MENKINPINESVKEAIKRKSAFSLPHNPSEMGYKPEEIKQAFYSPIIDATNSSLAEIDRVAEETNKALEELEKSGQKYSDDALEKLNRSLEEKETRLVKQSKDYVDGSVIEAQGSVDKLLFVFDEEYKFFKVKPTDQYISGEVVIPSHRKHTDGKYYPVREFATVTVINKRDEEEEGTGFFYCKEITKVTLPNTIKVINKFAFKYCEKLTSINVPYGVETIGVNAFSHCLLLSTLDFPETVKTIEGGALYHLPLLTEFVVKDTVTTLEWSAFNGSEGSGLVRCKIGSGVTSIPQNCFHTCTKLEGIDISDNIQSIGSSAFYNCTLLKTVSLPKSVKTIYPGAFNGSGLNTVRMESETPPQLFAGNTFPSTVTIEVPKQAVEAYRSADYYGAYTIVGYDTVKSNKDGLDNKLDATEKDNLVPNTRTVNGKGLNKDITLNAEDIGAYSTEQTDAKIAEAISKAELGDLDASVFVPKTRTVNGKTLNEDITLSAKDIGTYSKEEIDSSIANAITGVLEGIDAELTELDTGEGV